MAWLHRLARLGDAVGVAQALAVGDDPNAVTPDGWTPLILAAREGQSEVVAALLAAGADANRGHPNGRRPLHVAASKGYVEAIRALVAAGADLEALNNWQQTPILEAAHSNQVQTVQVLVELGADSEAQDGTGKTAADWLALGGTIGESEAFLDQVRGPKIDGLYAAGPGMEQNVRRKMAEELCADRYAAIHGRNVLVCSYGLHKFEGPAVHAWAHRLASILADRSLLTECEERYLSGDELEEARAVRAKDERRARRKRPLLPLAGNF